MESLWSDSESWPVEQPTSTWIQPAQDASLSSLYPSWKLLLISKCHKFHSLLCLGAFTMGAGQKGGEQWNRTRLSFFPLPLLWGESLMLALHFQASAVISPILSVGAQHETAPVAEISWLSIVQRAHHFTDIWRNLDILRSFIYLLILHRAASSP